MKKALLLLFSLLCFSLGATTARPGGKDYALFIAVEQYDNSSSWKTLPGLIQECKDIRSDLVSRYGFAEESKVLENPTLSEVMAELARWRARTYGPDDQLLVFFSGHGKFLDDLQEGFFIPRDGKPVSGDITDRKWYSLLQLPWHINTIPCRHILLAIDACYSSTIDNRVALKVETEDGLTPSNTGDARFNQYVHDLLANKSRILMTSGGKTRTKHPSDFARDFREALATLGGKDRLLRTADIEEFWPLGDGRPLTGNFEGHESGGNFLFVYQPKASAPTPPPPAVASVYDSDGIADKDDACPRGKGSPVTNDCPEPQKPAPSAIKDPLTGAFVEVTGGKFYVRNTNRQAGAQPMDEVEISTFWLSQYEVTIGQYLAFCEATNSHWPAWLEIGNEYHIETGNKQAYYSERGMSRTNTDMPITGVSWGDAAAYCNWLSEKTGLHYRLPTEAEWEFAARGGMKSKKYTYAGSDTLNEVGWYASNSGSKVHAVGGKKANELGLYDMNGNVFEWCSDWYEDKFYQNIRSLNPQGSGDGTYRVFRGCSCGNFTQDCRLTLRHLIFDPTYRTNDVGFRVAQDRN